VTLTEAWQELGVEPGADAETVRRAYLRLIKTRKPESDPAGFQRAREAFEIARAGGEIESLASDGARRHQPSAFGGDAPAPAASQGPGAPGQAAAAAKGDGDERSQADIVFDGFSSAWNSVPPSANQRQRLEIAREAVAVLPNDPRAHWLLVTTLSRLGPDAALADALRAGWRAGWPEFLEALLVRLPGRATREEIDAAFASSEPMTRLAAAAAAVSWDAPRAAALIVELCKTAMDAPLGARDDCVRDLPIARMLDVILALYATGGLEPAADAMAALRSCLHETGLELALVQGPLGGVWTLTEEIAGLPPAFPQPLRTAFAISTRTGDLTSAFMDALAAIARDRRAVHQWANQVGGAAPNVAAILRNALAQATDHAVRRTGFQVSRLTYLLIPLALAAVRVCATSTERSYTAPSVTVSDEAYAPTPSLYARPDPIGASSGSLAVVLDMTRQAAADLCGPEGPRHGQLVCADVERLVEALRTRACDDVPVAIRQLKFKLRDSAKDELEARFFNRATMARWQICGGANATDPGGDDR
jgi:hypothetical protein